MEFPLVFSSLLTWIPDVLDLHLFEPLVLISSSPGCTDKKENQIFLIYKEIQSGAVEVIYEEGLPNQIHFVY